MMTEKYKFKFLLVTDDIILEDSDVKQFTFINLGAVNCTINNQLVLYATGTPQYNLAGRYTEVINSLEQTAQGYKLVFPAGSNPDQRFVQVIMKIKVI
jgi:hypothetical protein